MCCSPQDYEADLVLLFIRCQGFGWIHNNKTKPEQHCEEGGSKIIGLVVHNRSRTSQDQSRLEIK